MPDSTMRTLRVAACMLTASVGLACVRPLLQAHLHTGMVGWWTQRNAARNLQVRCVVDCHMHLQLAADACQHRACWVRSSAA